MWWDVFLNLFLLINHQTDWCLHDFLIFVYLSLEKITNSTHSSTEQTYELQPPTLWTCCDHQGAVYTFALRLFVIGCAGHPELNTV